MFGVSSSHRKIIEILVAGIVIFMMAFYPSPFAIAQETEGGDGGDTTEEVVETETQPEESQETQSEETDSSGGEGQDGGDATDGTDGATGGDGGTSQGDESGGDGGDTGNADDGADDQTGGEEENGTGEQNTSVETGDAESQGSIENFVDLTMLQTLAEAAGIDLPPLVLYYVYYDSESGTYKTSDPSRQDELDEALEDGILDPQEYLEVVTPEVDTVASTTNDAVVQNEAEVTAETGDNEANYNDNVTINTGDATAVANVLNVVNTNIFDSEGFFLFLDNLSEDGVQGNLDFRDFDFFNPENVSEEQNSRASAGDNPITAICPTCGGAGDLTINTGQNAEITNDIVVRSGTGANEGLYNTGDTTINTGDAYAAANAINLANTNIVDSNYLLLTFNNFGDYNDDIVFPSAGEFLEMFETGGQTTPSQVDVDNTSTTDVDNNTDVQGVTGDNTAHETPDGGTITTGNANASSNTLNQINSNLFGGSSFSILVKVHGEWNGDVLGIPDDMTWRETEEGIELIYDSEGASCTGGACNGYDAIDVTTDNATQITNNISVLALTGENKIEGAGGEAEINTGDAFAAANTINVANTNVIGKNWMMAVVNIFGDWNGNITFGQPNLWVGAKANIPTVPTPGTEFTYQYTVMNTGDAPASNVCLRNRFDHRLVDLHVLNPVTDREVAAGDVEYCIGTVDPGEIREITRQARIAEHLGYGTTYITNDIEVQGGGDDPFQEDNFEAVTIDVSIVPPSNAGTGAKIQYKPSPQLSISKVNSSPFFVRASSTVDYRVIVKNTGAGSAYNAVLIDTLYDENDNKIYEEYWNLGEVFAGEEIEIFYTTFFNNATEPGMYRNVARIEALGGYHTFKYGHDASVGPVESSIKIVPNPNANKEEEVVEIIEDSKEVTETINEDIIEEGTGTTTEEVVGEEGEGETPVLITQAKTKTVPEFDFVFGPYHGPMYYEREDDRSLFALFFDHPQFTGHPVHIAPRDPLAFFGPLFTQHPVHIQHSYLKGGKEQYVFPIIGDVTAAVGFIKLLSLPFNDLSFGEGEERTTRTLALIALSMFVLRNPRNKV